MFEGHAVTQAVSLRLPTAAARARATYCGICAERSGIGQVFSEYFDFPCQSLFHQMLHNHRHLLSGAGTIGQIVAAVPSGLNLTPTRDNIT
jgi:hypothetical protein